MRVCVCVSIYLSLSLSLSLCYDENLNLKGSLIHKFLTYTRCENAENITIYFEHEIK